MKILIVCGAGISTSIMAAMMEDFVSDQDKIIATSYDRMNRYIDDVDVLLVAPQIKNLYYHIEEKCNEENVGCVLLSNELYGHLDGQKAVEIAKSLYKEREEKSHKFKILLICGAGITTSILVHKVVEAAEQLAIDIDCEAQGISNLYPSRTKGVNIVLLGPQVGYMEEEVRSNYPNIPVKVIGTEDFGKMDGKKVLEDIVREFNLLECKKEN